MRIHEKRPPREFNVGCSPSVKLRDCAVIALDPDEMVTFRTASGRNYDVVAKSWGFYATPSMNGRLHNEGFKSALVQNSFGKYYIMLVERGREDLFKAYLAGTAQKLVEWLDERAASD